MKLPHLSVALAVLFAAPTFAKPKDVAPAYWQKDAAARAQADALVRKLLRKPLTVSSAVQIALLSNRHLQATFEEIGIARADVLEAVTVPNPSVEFEVQFPVMSDAMNRYAWLVAQEFVQILMAPLKKRIAEEQLEAAELRVAAEVLDLVADVKKAFVTAQADQEILAQLATIQQTTAASLDLTQKQYKAGNATDLVLLHAQTAYDDGRLELTQARATLQEHNEQLDRLLGLWGEQADWKIAAELPPVPDADFSMQRLESLAVAQRADLRAAHREVTTLASALGLTKTFRWVPVLDFGFSGERDIDGALNMGPQFRLEFPIFNQGQARVARGESELRRAAAKFEALAVDIRSEVREARDKLASLRDRSKFYHDEVLPTREHLVSRSLAQYNAMQLSPYELFLAQADRFKARRDSIATLRDYWIARAELERAVGGSLTPHLSSEKSLVAKEKK